jgi:single-strand DNA-binding protein
MARGLNKATIIGFVEQQPERRYTTEGRAVASFSVSTNRRWTTNAGEDREAIEWFHIVAWGKLAELVGERLQENQRIYAEGHLQTRGWEDETGQRHFRTEVVASKIIPMDNRYAMPDGEAEDNSPETPLCLNRVMVIGNLGRDPEMRYTPSGQAVTCFSLAATRSWTKTSGNRRDATEWFNVVSWGSLAEICNQFLTKGRRVYIEGELRTRGWEQPGGKKHFRTELVANEMIMLGPRPSAGGAKAAPNSDKEDWPF